MMELMKNGLGLPAVKRISQALAQTSALQYSLDEAAFIKMATFPLDSLELSSECGFKLTVK